MPAQLIQIASPVHAVHLHSARAAETSHHREQKHKHTHCVMLHTMCMDAVADRAVPWSGMTLKDEILEYQKACWTAVIKQPRNGIGFGNSVAIHSPACFHYSIPNCHVHAGTRFCRSSIFAGYQAMVFPVCLLHSAFDISWLRQELGLRVDRAEGPRSCLDRGCQSGSVERGHMVDKQNAVVRS